MKGLADGTIDQDSSLPIRLPDPKALEETIVSYLVNLFGAFPGFSEWGPRTIRRRDSDNQDCHEDGKTFMWDSEFANRFHRRLDNFCRELGKYARTDFEAQVVGSLFVRKALFLKEFRGLAKWFKDLADSHPPGMPEPNERRRRSTISATHVKDEQALKLESLTRSLQQQAPGALSFLQRNSNVFDQFASRVRDSLYFGIDEASKFSDIQYKVEQGAKDLGYRGVDTNGPTRATFKVNWELQRFMEEEMGSPNLGSVVTISGSAICGLAVQCSVYVKEQWSELGLCLLDCIRSALSAASKSNGMSQSAGSGPNVISNETQSPSFPAIWRRQSVSGFISL
jgi:hypothetical protein